MFSLKRQGDFRLQLTRTLKTPGRHQLDLYLFTPHESTLSPRTLAEEQFFFSALSHRFGLLGLPAQDRASKLDTSYSLLSPHYEIMHGAWFYQYLASLDRLRQQLQGKALAEPLARALRLSQNFAQRLRKAEPKQSKQLRYFRQLDVYFSWLAEQFLLECMTLEGFAELDEELRQSVEDFLAQERRYRRERDYLGDFQGTPTRVWNRMSLYQRLLEYPVVLRQKITELGAGTRKLVKAASTVLIMSLFTYFLFNVRDASQQLSLALLLGIALIYAVRERRPDRRRHALAAQGQAALEDPPADAVHPALAGPATGLAGLPAAARAGRDGARACRQMGHQRGAADHLLPLTAASGQGNTDPGRNPGAPDPGLRTALRDDPGQPPATVRVEGRRWRAGARHREAA